MYIYGILSTIIFIVVLIVLVTKNVIENNRDKKLKLNNE